MQIRSPLRKKNAEIRRGFAMPGTPLLPRGVGGELETSGKKNWLCTPKMDIHNQHYQLNLICNLLFAC